MYFYGELAYLGFVISKYGMKMDPKNVEAIINWPVPQNVYEVRSFHGLAIFYQKNNKSFSSLCAPIIETIKEFK